MKVGKVYIKKAKGGDIREWADRAKLRCTHM